MPQKRLQEAILDPRAAEAAQRVSRHTHYVHLERLPNQISRYAKHEAVRTCQELQSWPYAFSFACVAATAKRSLKKRLFVCHHCKWAFAQTCHLETHLHKH